MGLSNDVNLSSEREAEILKPLASVEVTEKEDAMFETEISEDDVPGEWKLKGEVLTRSPVRQHGLRLVFVYSVYRFSLPFIFICDVMCPSDVRHPNGGRCAEAHAEKLPAGSGRRGVLPGSECHHQRNAEC